MTVLLNEHLDDWIHVFCVLHLTRNAIKNGKANGEPLQAAEAQKAVFGAARSENETVFTSKMSALQEKYPVLYAYLNDLEPQVWVAYASKFNRFLQMTSNVVEGPNSYYMTWRQLSGVA